MFALAGCAKSPTKYEDRIQVADANAKNALLLVSDLTDRVDQLETDKAALEGRLDDAESKASELESKLSTVESEFETLNSRVPY